MSKEHIYQVWAPAESVWSNWVKPVLFASMDEGTLANDIPFQLPDQPYWIPQAGGTALVIDLPAEEGVLLGLTTTFQGYRPIPLYNAVPGPSESQWAVNRIHSQITVVEVESIMKALWWGTNTLLHNPLPDNAPPAFLLDANRRIARYSPQPGRFDNRSVSFTTDFPSANFLLAHGITEVLLIQAADEQPQGDLAHTLRRWQEGGIGIQIKRLNDLESPMPLIVAKPSWFGVMWQRVLISLGLRRHTLGGFGGTVPVPSSS